MNAQPKLKVSEVFEKVSFIAYTIKAVAYLEAGPKQRSEPAGERASERSRVRERSERSEQCGASERASDACELADKRVSGPALSWRLCSQRRLRMISSYVEVVGYFGTN